MAAQGQPAARSTSESGGRYALLYLYTLSPNADDTSPPWSSPRHMYPPYRTQTQMFNGREYGWNRTTAALANASSGDSSDGFIEFVMSPNNPDDKLHKAVLCGSAVLAHQATMDFGHFGIHVQIGLLVMLGSCTRYSWSVHCTINGRYCTEIVASKKMPLRSASDIRLSELCLMKLNLQSSSSYRNQNSLALHPNNVVPVLSDFRDKPLEQYKSKVLEISSHSACFYTRIVQSDYFLDHWLQ
ncbi:hypothetical protein U9M48_009187 [Paspalum notatum var. saurae]|uniref:Alliinase C-terminal domain-containing protein n=1 Tax=Paspalum notatum var. saurae TaxID=547442 RepID=A0AAQ3SQR5_PASNO